MRVALGLILLAASSFAQNNPDFSGIFLRTESRFRNQSEAAIPRIIEIKQTTEDVLVTATQNLETATARYSFVSKNKKKAEARLQGRNLVVKTTAVTYGPVLALFSGNWLITQVVEEKWELSADAQQLMIHRKIGGDSGHVEIYTREPSRDAALTAATAAGSKSGGNPLFRLNNRTLETQTYKQGYELGMVLVQRITRCVTYDAVLSGDFFKGLQPIKEEMGSHFMRAGQMTNASDGDLVLEVEPHPYDCLGEAETWTQTVPPPESSLGLRFMVRWLGSEQRDLGEVQSELRYEPLREWSNPVAFYRMHIPARDIPLTDDLEITIFSKTGEQLASWKGHL